jgi:hypothetical protein
MGISSANAGVILEVSQVKVTVTSLLTDFTDILDRDGGTVVPGDPTIFESLIEPSQLVRFPTSPSALPQGFASASFSASGEGGVGISGVTFRRHRTQANARYEQTIANRGDADANLSMNYQIPFLEAAILAGPNVEGVLADARANFGVTIVDSNGVENFFQIYDYDVQIERAGGVQSVFRSSNLITEQGDGELFTAGDVGGVRYATFGGTRLLPAIPPGGRMEIAYFFNAVGQNVTPELGYQAFVGDPFDISAGGGFEIRLAEPAPVPEPATILLIPGALAGLLLARRGRSRKAV